MKLKIKILKISIIILLILSLSVACSSKMKVVEFIPDFSQDRMMETIRLMSSKDSGRIAGFIGEENTADYIKSEFESMGLDVSEQVFPVKAFACENVSLKILEDENTESQSAKALTFSAATSHDGLFSEIMSVGMGTKDDYSGTDVDGKIVLVMRGGEYFRVKVERANENGAIAAIFYDPNGEGAISATLTQLSSIPAISIARKEAEKLEELIEENGNIKANLIVDSISEDSFSKNVIGLYESTDNPGGNCVIVGAHYDGVDTPAANDNASGTAVLIEIAKALSDQKIPLPYDVKFIAFGAEEIGLIGSKAYVNQMSRTDKESVLSMINFDMVGVGDTFELNTAEGVEEPEILNITTELLEGMGYIPTISKTDRSDHSPFSYVGIQALYIAIGPFGNYHTDLDTHEAISPETLVQVCEIGAKLLIEELPKLIY